ncbi:hypothetical protein [Bradyrhizobium centrosematis]|uniref:hypothetical protein n=1 Tax=Bradyrhizobium centrosematis TaxID=1300039 RepID=UPI002167F471|nr:hypothetical protein [Bradyrhizobium centrosematis]MCS3765801.1 hypothetical protein [Bradyrhizobium centrosematis]MCS3778319.1 hypothetical protein [Bradyrhizobium centrosematis]
MKRPSKQEALDLAEMRRQIIAVRSRHSENLRVTYLLNRLLVKIAYLTEPESPTHAEQLREAFTRTMTDVETITRDDRTAPPGKAN